MIREHTGAAQRTAAKDPGDPAHYGLGYDRSAADHLWEYQKKRVTHLLLPDEEVFATQHYIDPDHPAVENYDPAKDKGKDRPQLVGMGGESFINDGHHRIAGARRAGLPIKVHVWYDPDEDIG